MRLKKPRWDFPPTHGGVEIVREPAATNFREAPLDKFVREILQNSTDAHDHNAGPVEVVFREESHPSDLFGADALTAHTRAAMEAAREEEQPRLVEEYRRATEVLSAPTIRCLSVADRNTTGLSGPKWDALILKSGSNRKDGAGAGGSQGVGKNAVFNVSAAKTAFYYTCFQNGKGRRRHRVEKWMGKSVLASHTIKGKRLQHIGFYRLAGGKAMEGSDTPDMFRTPPNGAAITVLGFEPRAENWTAEIAKAAAASFFYAIHRGNLIVTVESMSGERIRIDAAALKSLFERYGAESDGDGDFARAFAYYKAALQPGETATAIELPEPIGGAVDVRVSLDDGPSRSAYINMNGMFVTDSREVHKNPFHIRASRHSFPQYAIIATPSDDHTNEFIRDLENPAHDEIQTNSIDDPARQRKTKAAFGSGRKRIIEILNEKTDKEFAESSVNLSELAGMFADDEGNEKARLTRKLVTRIRRTNFQTASAALIPDSPTPPDPTPPKPDPKPRPKPDPKPPNPNPNVIALSVQ